MTEQQLDRLVCFFYLLTRGTPGVPGMGWGDVKTILRKGLAPFGSQHVYTSPAGEALAREIVHELLTGQAPPDEQAAAADDLVRIVDADTIDKMFSE